MRCGAGDLSDRITGGEYHDEHEDAAFGLAIESVVLCLVGSQPALATDPTPNWCEGVRIAAFPGGYGPGSGDRYSEAVYNGYRQAALDLGPTVTFYFSHWSPDEMIRDFKRAIDEKVDGVAFIGFGYNAAADVNRRRKVTPDRRPKLTPPWEGRGQ